MWVKSVKKIKCRTFSPVTPNKRVTFILERTDRKSYMRVISKKINRAISIQQMTAHVKMRKVILQGFSFSVQLLNVIIKL